MRYEIDKNNAITIYTDGQDAPILFQPDWPDTTPFASKSEAEDWAIVKIKALQEPNSEFIAGPNPENHPQARPAEEPEAEA